MNHWNGMYREGPTRYFIQRRQECDRCSKDCHRCNVAIGQIKDVIATIPGNILNYEICGLYIGQPVYRRLQFKPQVV